MIGRSPGASRSLLGRLVVVGSFMAVVCLTAAVYEMRTSRLQAAVFSRMAAGIGYVVEEGPSDAIAFPDGGPYDVRLGYTRVPETTRRLDSLGFELTHQARHSERLLRVVDQGAYAVYPTKTSAGLAVFDRRGNPIVTERYPAEAYPTFDAIPEVLWRTLLFIESRYFLSEQPQRNPAVEWARFVRSVVELGLRYLGAEGSVAGGSTLATQIEKYRHTPGGITRTPTDKMRQMFTASLRAYRDGPDTHEERREIVRNYLNSVPLAAQVGHGEVIGTADGLWAWYGIALDSVSRVLNSDPSDAEGRQAKAEVYRRVVSLLLAHRRPSHYLTRPDGRADLADLTDAYLGLLVGERVIPRWLADEARRARDRVQVLDHSPDRPPRSFAERKAINLVRTELLRLVGVPGLYELDRLDLTAQSTLDMAWHEASTELLRSLGDPSFVASTPFSGARVLDVGDPSRVLYSITLMERAGDRNVLRVQTDNLDGPLSLGGASRLELGSTAKLRTLVSYLEVVEELYDARASASRESAPEPPALPESAPEPPALPAESAPGRPVASGSPLEAWVETYLAGRPDATKEEVLDAAMERRYSASPAERFVTGGGTQTFGNFDNTYDQQTLTVREAFRQSVNLPFVRIMRDVVAYEIDRLGVSRALANVDDPLRREYLERFADQEGSRFVRQFFVRYGVAAGPAVFDTLLGDRRLGSRRAAWAVRAVAPDADLELFTSLLSRSVADEGLSEAAATDLFRRSDPAGQSLSDLGYLARIHPLELWVASYMLHNPGASLAEVLEESRSARIEVYGWLFRTRRRDAQDQRIRTMMEIEAFDGVLRRWRRLGYPFGNIVPSLGTAIGSSGDRPQALAELAGVVLNGGLRYRVERIGALSLAPGTPFETRFRARPREPERVMSREVAERVRGAMVDVVENGTGRRARGAFRGVDGEPMEVGGKTGTGDNRFRVFAPGGALMESRVVNRTSSFVFLAGDRYFGVVVAYVPGPAAGAYRFTSALPTQLLQVLAPRLDTGALAPSPPDP